MNDQKMSGAKVVRVAVDLRNEVHRIADARNDCDDELDCRDPKVISARPDHVGFAMRTRLTRLPVRPAWIAFLNRFLDGDRPALKCLELEYQSFSTC